jgi:pre-mRNA-processing factor SLU7
VGGAQMKVTARNLRIREDTAKYLRNLDPNSAYYDPKSRSMRDNPHPETAAADSQYAGDNFARVSGDAVALADTQLFAWDATDQGVGEIHPQANPSQAEMLKKQFKSKESDLKLQRKKAVLDKYGGEEYLDGQDGLATTVGKDGDKKSTAGTVADRKLRFGVSTAAEEFSRDGRMLGSAAGAKREAIPCKYEEDIFINGHRTVWGSFFHSGAFQWGYKDDHSLMKSSYCTGQNGRRANDEANEMRYGTGKAGSAALAQARGMLKALPGNERTGKSSANATMANRSKMYGEANQNPDLDQAKLKQAMKKAEQEQSKQEAEDDRKRKYHSMNAEVDVTEEDMEAYRLQKGQKSDPMANIGSDKLLDYK